jgi:long-chain acyl-CoA synthetase
VSYPVARQIGSCGQVAPGFEIRITADGEVLVRGQTVMREYWRRPAETQQVLDAEGWLHTGDVGYLDEAGFLYLTGHKQELLVLSTGRKVNPVQLETALTDNPFVAQAAVFGEGCPYVSAVLVPDLEALTGYFQEQERPFETAEVAGSAATSLKWFWPGDDELSQLLMTTAHPVVKQVLDEVVAVVNQQLDSWEHIIHYSLLDQACSKAANELAQLKTKGRTHLTAHYTPVIESMYPLSLPDEERQTTQVQVSPERLHDLLEKERILDAWLADANDKKCLVTLA